jgi:TPP-dependent indolepyruvate ferredoxin oxidoreductase alpha subunit
MTRLAVELDEGTRGQAREDDAASVYGYTGTPVHRYTETLLRACSQVQLENKASGQAREETAASVYGYTGTLRASSAGPNEWAGQGQGGGCGERGPGYTGAR